MTRIFRPRPPDEVSRFFGVASFINFAHAFHEQNLPIEIDCLRAAARSFDFGNHSAFPAQNFVKGIHAVQTRRGGVPDLTVFKKDTGLLSTRPGEFKYRGGPAHALQLNDIGEMQIAQCPLKFLAIFLAGGVEQCLHEIRKIGARKWFLQKVDCAEALGLFAVRLEVNRP